MDSNLVSIIIPAYNSGKHLRDMLESIYAQTYPFFEVIVAYDTKSSDNTLEILREYEDRYQLIIDVGRDSSSGEARNRGLRLAKGEFVIFMDADDFVLPSYIENLVDIFHEYPELDAVCGSYKESNEDNIEDNYNLALSSSHQIQIHSQEDALNCMIKGKPYGGTPWTWLVKKHYLDNSYIRFPDYSYGDDTVYVFRLIVNTSHIGYSTKQGYIFIQHNTSLTHRMSSFVELYDKRERSREDIRFILGEPHSNIYSQHLATWNRYLAYHLTMLCYKEFKSVLASRNVDELQVIYGDSLLLKMGVFCFNQSKYLFWILCRVLRMSVL